MFTDIRSQVHVSHFNGAIINYGRTTFIKPIDAFIKHFVTNKAVINVFIEPNATVI